MLVDKMGSKLEGNFFGTIENYMDYEHFMTYKRLPNLYYILKP